MEGLPKKDCPPEAVHIQLHPSNALRAERRADEHERQGCGGTPQRAGCRHGRQSGAVGHKGFDASDSTKAARRGGDEGQAVGKAPGGGGSGLQATLLAQIYKQHCSHAQMHPKTIHNTRSSRVPRQLPQRRPAPPAQQAQSSRDEERRGQLHAALACRLPVAQLMQRCMRVARVARIARGARDSKCSEG